MSYQAYQKVGCENGCVVSVRGMDDVPNLRKVRVRVWMLYYQRVEYGYRCRTKLTKRSGTGMDVLSSLPKGRV